MKTKILFLISNIFIIEIIETKIEQKFIFNIEIIVGEPK